MKFSTAEIDKARRLRQLGLPWEPHAGHFVFDETGFCQRSSPFQPGVYFILNYEFFMERAGGVERFKELMTWLPTWHDAREVLRSVGVPDAKVAEKIRRRCAIENCSELLVLYGLIEAELQPVQPAARTDDIEHGE